MDILWRIVVNVLTLQSDVYLHVIEADNGRYLALLILCISGVSLAIGQSVVLFANRIPRRRYFLSLTGGAITLMAAALVWALLIWFITLLLGLGERPFTTTFTIIAMSFAPLWFGFLVLIPVFGIWLGKLLRLWVFICVLVGVATSYQLGFWSAFFCCLSGWMLIELFNYFSVIDDQLRKWLWQETSGLDKQVSVETLADQLAQDTHLGTLNSDQESQDA